MKVFITGISGYVARVTLPYLFADDEITEVIGYDIRPPKISHPKLTFIEGDVRSDRIEKAMTGADVVVHMAFIVGEIKDKQKIYDINVNGTKQVLKAVKNAGILRLINASSICAYGAQPNRSVITEDTPLAGNPDSYYSHTKHLGEELLNEFEKENPEIALTRLRPSILCGPKTDNFFIDLVSTKIIFYPDSNPGGLPLVHEDDVGRAFHLAIKNNVSGSFNIAGGNLPYKTLGKIIGKKILGLPFIILKPLSDIGFALGISPISSHWVVLSRYPFNLNCDKAKEQLGWEPSRSPEESFRELVVSWKQK